MKKVFIKMVLMLLILGLAACDAKNNEPVPSAKPSLDSNSVMMIDFLDVGYGDALLIQLDSKALLIDGGSKDQSQKMYAVLKEKKIDHLEAIIATSLSDEHIGGLAGALNAASADNVFAGKTDGNTEVFQNFKKYADKNGGGLKGIYNETSFEFGNALIQLIPADSQKGSLMVQVSYKETSFLFVPDIDSDALDNLLAGYKGKLKSTVIKLPNHGDDQVSLVSLLKETEPETAVISTDHLTASGTLDVLDMAVIGLVRTDLHGDIKCKTDGKTVVFEPAKTVDESKLYEAAQQSSAALPEVTPTPAATPTPVATPTPASTPKPSQTPSVQPDSSLNVSIDEIYEANLLTNLLARHGSVRETTYFDNTSYITGSFLIEDKPANLFTVIYPDGYCSYNGWFDGYTYYYDGGERVIMQAFIEELDGDQIIPGQQDKAYYFEYDDELVYEGKKDNCYLFSLNFYGTKYSLTVDCESLALLRVEWDTSDGVDYYEYIYGEWIPGQDIMNNWTNGSGLKCVSVYVDLDVDGQTLSLYRPFYMPLNWELDVTSFQMDVFTYMDPKHTIPYEYPGDGINYELYVTNAAG